MARVLVVSDDGATTAEVVTDDDGWTVARCACGEEITDRGRYEDTVQAAQIHVDRH